MTHHVLLTGATGFLGTVIAGRLLRDDTVTVYALVRAKDNEAAEHRLRSEWYWHQDLYREIGQRIIPLAGDILKENLGLSAADMKMLQENTSHVIHAAAEVGLQKSADELMAVNRDGTAAVLQAAAGMTGLQRFVYVSTAYTCGRRSGPIREEDAPGTRFYTYYEQSKAEAEQLVKASSLPYIICRPGMIVGDSVTGYTRTFNTVYYVLKQILTEKTSVLPVRGDTRLNLVPVDYVADAIVRLAFNERAAGLTFHLTCPQELQPSAAELTEYVRGWAKENLQTELPAIRFAPLPGLKTAGLVYNRNVRNKKKSAANNLMALAPYFNPDQQFDRHNTDTLAGIHVPVWREYIDVLLTYACRKNFMRQTGRTVFEQACVRRASTRYPVRYHDVSAAGISDVSGEEVNRRIAAIVNALYAWGIRPGDRVALTGINSIDYMTIDMAIGLLGAVSVPIYYTSPIDEVQLLMERSGAKWLFVGDRRIMKNIEQLDGDIRVVAFSDGLQVHKPGVMHWEQFLYEAREEAPAIRVNPEDLATIRYTSGTTGEPKGVMFNFAQLAWMGEVLTNLLPWQDRNKTMRYLSFLPLSHVVEGILASYAPYYVLADVDFYFLNDFGTLTEALPKIRPNVFFSVPRFYEKVWNQLTATAPGKAYLNMPDGPAKKTMAAVLRRSLLKKAGLDACRQLIVGSAPISEALLHNYRELGIEIYNAYGQAEAPLITINRLNDNIIPTIGTPLPETEVTIAEDGELIVKGPQVALGYYGLPSNAIQDGVLKTGDLGQAGPDGHFILYGRKKEMIITAYGKNISTPKVEGRLKSIPGVSEAVLIGEKHPYCTALLWLDHAVDDLDEKIRVMNEDLSHPEQVRRYRVMEKPLSIQAGELTPNLKVKRAVVEQHYHDIIEEMYR